MSVQKRSELILVDQDFSFDCEGNPSVSANVRGTISVGHYTPQVSNDNVNWDDVSVYNPSGNEVTAITVAGIYRADVNAYQFFKLKPSANFSGTTTYSFLTSATALLTKIVEAPVNNDLLALAWQAGTYPANSLVLHDGAFWIANAETSGEPGVTGWTSYASLAAALTYILNLFNPA